MKKVKLYLYIILLVGVVALMFALRNCNTEKPTETYPPLPHDYANIKELGTLRIVTDYNTVGYHVKGDTIMGLQYELIKALEKAWQIPVEIYLENSLDASLKGLLKNKYDIVARNITATAVMKDTFAFTTPISYAKDVLVQRKAIFNDSLPPIRQQLNLAGKIIHLHTNSPSILRIRNLADEIGDTIFIEQHDRYESEQLAMMVASGDIDFTVCDKTEAKYLAKKMPELDVETEISFTQFDAWALRKSSPVLLDSLNHWLEDFMTTKQFKQIIARYS